MIHDRKSGCVENAKAPGLVSRSHNIIYLCSLGSEYKVPLAIGHCGPDDAVGEAELDETMLEELAELNGGDTETLEEDLVVLDEADDEDLDALDDPEREDVVALDEPDEDELTTFSGLEEDLVAIDELDEGSRVEANELEEEDETTSFRPAFVEPSYTNWPSDAFG